MGMFDFLTGGGKDPSKEAMKYLNKIPGQISPYYDPYINAGKGALPGLEEQYGKLLHDPGALYAELGKGYKQSPGFDFALKNALGAAGNAAAAGGMAGSPMHEQQNMGIATDLASQDYDRYMKDILGLYGEGLEGEEGLYKTGFNASDTLARLLAENTGSKANAAYSGAANKNLSNQGLLESILGLGGAGKGLYDLFNKGGTPKYLDPFGLF